MQQLDTGFLLSSIPYRDTSEIVNILACDNGLIRGVVKGFHGSNRQAAHIGSCLQFGNLVEFSISGKASLKNLYNIDKLESARSYSTREFVCISYINELLLYLLPEAQPEPGIFDAYAYFVQHIKEDMMTYYLRRFELYLLQELGYGMDFSMDNDTQDTLLPDSLYQLVPAIGIQLANEPEGVDIFLGKDLLSVHEGQLGNAYILGVCKRITRLLLDYYLAGRSVKSRQMYKELFTGD